jgi:hypothetical protein
MDPQAKEFTKHWEVAQTMHAHVSKLKMIR